MIFTEDFPLILALDTSTLEEAEGLLDNIESSLSYVKIGHRLYALGGIPFLEKTMKRGLNVFLDLKLHDIPNTVSIALEPLMNIGLWSLTLHTAGGREMLEGAVQTKGRLRSGTLLLGVTVLTSHSPESWEEVNPGCSLQRSLVERARLSAEVGMDGIVCSPLDLPLINLSGAEGLIRVVPGVRLQEGKDDQKRVTTPGKAFLDGADYIVVGRPIIKAPDPLLVIQKIREQYLEVRDGI